MGILSKVVKAQEVAAQDRLKILVYGLSGSGKSSMAGTSGLMDVNGNVGEERDPDGGRMLYAWTEANGKLSVSRLGTDCDMIHIASVDDLRDLLAELKAGRPDSNGLVHGYHTLVLDSLTELQRLIMDQYKDRSGAKGKQDITIAQWGEIIDRTLQMVRSFRDLPLHIIVTALASETTVDESAEEKRRLVRPEVKGRSLPSELAQFFHAVGYSFRRLRDGRADYRVLLEGREDFLTKPCPGLAYQEVPDFPYMVRTVIHGGPLRDQEAKVAAVPGLSSPEEVRTEAPAEPDQEEAGKDEKSDKPPKAKADKGKNTKASSKDKAGKSGK